MNRFAKIFSLLLLLGCISTNHAFAKEKEYMPSTHIIDEITQKKSSNKVPFEINLCPKKRIKTQKIDLETILPKQTYITKTNTYHLLRNQVQSYSIKQEIPNTSQPLTYYLTKSSEKLEIKSNGILQSFKESHREKISVTKYSRDIANKLLEETSISKKEFRWKKIASTVHIQASAPTVPEIRTETKVSKEAKSSNNQTNVEFKLTILPVRFVYIEDGEIVKIWNNTKENDSRYALKFFDYRTEEEINPTNTMYATYNQLITQLNVFSEGIIFEKGQTVTTDEKITWDIQMSYTSKGSEEVHTYI